MFDNLNLSQKKFAEEIVDAIAEVCAHRKVALHEPILMEMKRNI